MRLFVLSREGRRGRHECKRSQQEMTDGTAHGGTLRAMFVVPQGRCCAVKEALSSLRWFAASEPILRISPQLLHCSENIRSVCERGKSIANRARLETAGLYLPISIRH